MGVVVQVVILEQAFFAQRRIWASHAKRRVPFATQ
jgi:hypothetical protein